MSILPVLSKYKNTWFEFGWKFTYIGINSETNRDMGTLDYGVGDVVIVGEEIPSFLKAH